MTDTITIKGLDKLTKKIKNIEGLKPVIAALKAGATHIKGKIAEYPPAERAHRPQPFISDKQRRWFFAALRSGEIEVPYRRTFSPNSETLSKKWTIGERDGGLTQIIGNNVSYGPFVQGNKQTAFHRVTGWKTTDQVAEEEAKTVNKFVQEHIEKALSD